MYMWGNAEIFLKSQAKRSFFRFADSSEDILWQTSTEITLNKMNHYEINCFQYASSALALIAL